MDPFEDNHRQYGTRPQYEDDEESIYPQIRIGPTTEETQPLQFPESAGVASAPSTASPYQNGRTTANLSPPRGSDYQPYEYHGDLSAYELQDLPPEPSDIDQHALLAPGSSFGYTGAYDPSNQLHAGLDPYQGYSGYHSDAEPQYSSQPMYGPQAAPESSYGSGGDWEKFDTEAQGPLQTSPSRFGLWGRTNSVAGWHNEYADDEALDYQLPIEGDEYALNVPYDENGESIEPQSPFDDDEGEDGFGLSRAKTVRLFRGNLVLDCPVSTKLLEQYPKHQPVREFTHMRYTAVTSEPENFGSDEYTLRQMCYSTPRQTELFVAITIYNEDDILLARTLQGVFNNVRHLCHRNRSSTWGSEAWKRVVVCILADGRDKIHPRAKALMASLGVYQEGFAKNMVNDKEVHAHLYEYTTMVRIASVSKNGVKLTTDKAMPVQLMFCLKEKNKKKINSHRWFFQSFAPVLRPKVCVLLDAGTRPGNHSIYHLWKTFDRNPQVGGACGEIAAMLGPGYLKLANPLVAAQNFEYKMSNILDKPSESVFGFISVLPGAFSAYRYEALLNDDNGNGPLEKYFKGEKLDGQGGIFQANMYLAEDRILCWELVAKRGQAWVLKYVKSAKAHTDVPEGLSELILQRRRWLNGSFFAQIYSLAHMFQIWRSSHSIGRKLSLHIQFFYQLVNLLFSWFSLANFFLVFHILTASLSSSTAHFAPGKVLNVVLTWVYIACLFVTFILSFGNRPKGTRRIYDAIVIFFALLMAYVVFASIYVAVKSIEYSICANNGFDPKMLVQNSTFRDLIISLLATYGLYLLSSLLFLDPWHMLTSLAQYVLLSPSYINVFNVYSFCNTHDISWGTKGDTAVRLDLGVVRANDAGKVELELPTSAELVDKYYLDEAAVLAEPPSKEEESAPSEQEKRSDYYALFRSSTVVVWVLMNVALMGVVLNVGGFQTLMGTDDKTGSTDDTSNVSKRSSSSCEELQVSSTTTVQIYLAVVLWSVCGMAAYRFVFAVAYLIALMFGY